jgi:Glutathione-dependent formaldehyde-activating enzyme
MVPKEAMRIIKGLKIIKIYTQKHRSSFELSIHSCSICSTTLFKHLHLTPYDANYVVQSGTLDGIYGKLGADIEPPESEGFGECRASWMPAVPGLEATQA